MQNKLITSINALEESIKNNMLENALMVLNTSILEINRVRHENNEIIMPILHMQISIELIIKNYIANAYGFESILTKKYKNIKNNSLQQYFKELQNNNITTLGFNDLKNFLEDNQDSFNYVIKDGISPFINFEYDFLEGTFDKFQKIRNNFVHLGVDLEKEDSRWLEVEFFTIVIFFISTILRELEHLKKLGKCSSYLNNGDIFSTPMDVLKTHLSSKSFYELLKNKCFLDNLQDLVLDYGNCYLCDKCKKEFLILDFPDSDGMSKCFCCGNLFYAGYTDCHVCKNNNSVVYDNLNIELNKNIMPGYCYNCYSKLKVYECPECNCSYSYSVGDTIKHYYSSCCKDNFVDRECVIINGRLIFK